MSWQEFGPLLVSGKATCLAHRCYQVNLALASREGNQTPATTSTNHSC